MNPRKFQQKNMNEAKKMSVHANEEMSEKNEMRIIKPMISAMNGPALPRRLCRSAVS